jgi:hypothetical protein
LLFGGDARQRERVEGLLRGRVASRAAWGEGRGEDNHRGHGVSRSFGYKSCLLRVTPHTPWLSSMFCNYSYHHVWACSGSGACLSRRSRRGLGLLRGCVASRAAWGEGAVRWTQLSRGRFQPGLSGRVIEALLPLTGRFAALYAGGDAEQRGISDENGVSAPCPAKRGQTPSAFRLLSAAVGASSPASTAFQSTFPAGVYRAWIVTRYTSGKYLKTPHTFTFDKDLTVA